MMKFEHVAEIGDIIRAADFEPRADVGECYIEGVVTAKGESPLGVKGYTITLTNRVLNDKVEPVTGIDGDGNRIAEIGLVPFEGWRDWDNRVELIAKVAKLNA